MQKLLRKLSPFTLIAVAVIYIGYVWSTSPKAAVVATSQPSLVVRVLDIGQGDSILLDTPHHERILVDGGPDGSVLSQLGRYLPFNVHTVNLMVATHNHSDHITGLIDVLNRYNVSQVWVSGATHSTHDYTLFMNAIRRHAVPKKVVWNGVDQVVDGVYLRVVFPDKDYTGIDPPDQHMADVVMRATYGNESILLTGDLNEQLEQQIVDSGAPVAADVLKVPHHGSCTGLADSFLAAVHPKYAIISVGADNPYGHPCARTIEKLRQAGVTVYRTDENGTVTAIDDGASWHVTPSVK